MEKLHTIANISRNLSIPESTLRYRAKLFKNFLPVKGTGRKKRFLEPSIERFEYMDTLFNKGMVADDIRVKLSEKYDSEIEAEVSDIKTKKKTTKKTESQSVVNMAEIQDFLVPMIKVIENQEIIISELKKQNKMLALAPAGKKGFWGKIFG